MAGFPKRPVFAFILAVMLLLVTGTSFGVSTVSDGGDECRVGKSDPRGDTEVVTDASVVAKDPTKPVSAEEAGTGCTACTLRHQSFVGSKETDTE